MNLVLVLISTFSILNLHHQFEVFLPMNDEIIRDADPNSPWTGNISKMQTRGVFINFTFQ